MKPVRSAGLLCPISALPSPYGIGDFGSSAERLVDWMQRAKLRYWQILPLTLPDSRGSPYASPSMVYGSWLYINPEKIPTAWKKNIRHPKFPATRPVRYGQVGNIRKQWLWKVWRQWLEIQTVAELRALARWRTKHPWVETAATYFAWKDRFHQQPWWKWPAHAANHKALPDTRLRPRQEFYVFMAWVFSVQWQQLKHYANQRGIKLVGDMPFYSPEDSVEAWSHRKYFHIDRRGHLTHVAGVPPDAMASGGQRWGNPVYDWSSLRRDGFQLWIDRLGTMQEQYDIVRLDHFQGYVHTWHIPIRDHDARRGRWVKTPGDELFRQIRAKFPRLQFVAEDLGISYQAAETLRKRKKIPGTRVWVFGWNGLADNPHDPNNVQSDMWYYTTTHDTNTVQGWWKHGSKQYERQHVIERLRDVDHPSQTAIRSVIQSKAGVAMLTIPDILGLGAEAQLNKPGTKRGNWDWRFEEKWLTASLAKSIREVIKNPHSPF